MANQNNSVIAELIPYQTPASLFTQFASKPGSILLDSTLFNEEYGRYSYIALDPFKFIEAKNGVLKIDHLRQNTNLFETLRRELNNCSQAYIPELPPFQGGMAGAFSYDLLQYIEDLNFNNDDEMEFPDLAVGLYDLVIAFDHLKKEAWILSTGWPEQNLDQRKERAQVRLEWLKSLLVKPEKELSVPIEALDSKPQISSNFTINSYEEAVKNVIAYILAGDIFEANISQRFQSKLPGALSAFQLYIRLSQSNPAPFSAYFNLGEHQVVSASPERFLKLTNKMIETRPIKGTRPRSNNPEDDQKLANELIKSEKDCAENVMIVDLLRNDLSKVSKEHSVIVEKLCGLETYADVHHLVSVVKAELKDEHDAVDLLVACFPGGSITGAPKIRAMQIIAEIEPNKRGMYCGSLGFIGFNGCMDTSIAIRTYTIRGRDLSFQAGGAVVVDSDPAAEYQETLTKAAALCRALG